MTVVIINVLTPAGALAAGGYPTCYVVNDSKTFILYFSGNGTIENCRMYRDVFNNLNGAPIWHMHDTTRTEYGWLEEDIYSPASFHPRCELSNDRGGTVDVFMADADGTAIWCNGIGEYGDRVL